MTDLLSLGASGLRAYQSALEVVGDNIANANTVGYARREARLTQGAPAGLGYPLVKDLASGNGVNVDGVRRAYDAFRSDDARTASGDYSRLEAKQRWLTELQSNLGTGTSSLGAGITRFFNAAQDVAADPNSTAARIAFLDSAGAVAARFRAASDSFDATRAGIRTEIGSAIDQANQITKTLADLNRSLVRADPESTQSASLRDQRDELLGKLGDLMRVSVSEKPDGSFEVRVGDPNGPVLVGSDGAKLLGTRLTDERTEITIDPFGANAVVMPAGGAIAGLIEAEAKVGDVSAQIDALATSFVAAVNSVHAGGVDLGGQPGVALFGATTLTAAASPANAGRASLSATVTNASNLAADGYTLWYDGPSAQWTLARADGGASVSGTGTLDLDGMRVELGGMPRHGDHFDIAPRAGAAGLGVLISDPAKIAAAAPWRGDAAAANQGSGMIAVRVDPDGTATLPAFTVRMTSASAYEIIDPSTDAVLATGSSASGAWVAYNGVEFQLSGQPAAGDSFTVARNGDGIADNANIRKLIDLRLAGTGGFEQRYEKQVAGVASALSDTKSLAEATKSLRDTNVAARDAASAVNLDQEAADLIRFQQAYQACSRVISVAQKLFDSVLQMS